jgi:S-formylglutathione hydrolase FrmB
MHVCPQSAPVGCALAFPSRLSVVAHDGGVASRKERWVQTRRPLAAPAVLAAALLLFGCGGDDKDDAGGPNTTRFPPTAPVNNENLTEGAGACGLLTRGEVEAAVGPANPGTGVRTKTNESCTWRLRAGANQFVAVITNTPGQQAYDNARGQVEGPEELSGVGDRAFVANDTAYALKGNRLIIVEVLSSQPVAARKQAATKLIQMAVPRS